MPKTDEEPIVSRLKRFIEYCELSNSQFADKAGIPRPTLSQLIHGRNKSVNDLLLRKLHEGFPELNITWLLFGLGNMLEDSNIKISEPQNKSIFTDSPTQGPVAQREASSPGTVGASLSDNPKQKTEFKKGETSLFGVINDEISSSFLESSAGAIPSPAPGKKIKSIIVLYTDSSFEVFSQDISESV